jgi:nitroreductase
MTRNLSSEKLIESLRWRYATKQFDPSQKIAPADWTTLEQVLILAPSSYGLQPWQFHVITNQALKESLVPHSWNQRQVADCSHLLVFAVWRRITREYVDGLIDSVAEQRGVPRASLDGYRRMMIRDIVEGPRSRESTQWAKLQAHIALGSFLTAAAVMGIDTCPMEGFVAERYDELLGFAERDLTTAVLCPAGYRAATDKYAQARKVRFPSESLIVRR